MGQACDVVTGHRWSAAVTSVECAGGWEGRMERASGTGVRGDKSCVYCMRHPLKYGGVNAAADARQAESYVTQKELTRGM